MKVSSKAVVSAVLILLAASAGPLPAQTREGAIVDSATAVLNEIMVVPIRSVPHSMLARAEGVAIIPNVVKLGFIGAVRHGRGVMLLRDPNGGWGPPIFITITGGSIGWQVGVQATDVVLVFKTRKSIEGITGGKFTIGVDAAVAAGPVGRRAEAATDAQLKAEIFSYSRSRGLFAGVSLDGSALQVDIGANAAYYGGTGIPPYGAPLGQPVRLPASAGRLMTQLARYTATPAGMPGMPFGSGAPTVTIVPTQPGAVAGGTTPAEAIRRRLGDSARQLHPLLDENWRTYLALPAEVYTGGKPSSIDAWNLSLSHYEKVAGDPRYRALAQRPEFRTTHALLKQYSAMISATASRRLALPPPPK